MANSTEALTKTFSSLADPVRRYVLYYLDEQENPVFIDRLATRVAAWHTDSTPEAADATLNEMRKALHHMHLPKLEQYGYIEWNKDAREVVKEPRFEETRPLLECVDDHAEIADQGGQSNV